MKNARFILLFAVCFAFLATYMNRSTISIALVSICKKDPLLNESLATDLTVVNVSDSKSHLSDVPFAFGDESFSPFYFWKEESRKGSRCSDHENSTDSEPICDHTNQGFIMSASFWSSLVFQIPFGILITRFGGFKLLLVCMILTGIFSSVTPLLVHQSVWLVVMSRFLLGTTAAAVSPATFHLIDVWMLKRDKSIASAFNSASQTAGIVVTLGFAGLIVEQFSWPGIFIFTGIAAFISSIIILIFVRDDPAKVSWMSTDELKEIKQEKDAIQNSPSSSSSDKKKSYSTPWLGIMTNRAFLSLLFFRFSVSWVNQVYANELPFFLDQMTGMSIKKNGLLSSATQVTRIVATISSGYIAEALIRYEIFSLKTTRKLFSVVLGFGQAICLVVIPFLAYNETILTILLLLSTFVSGFSSASTLPMHYELSNKHAVSLFTLSNTATNLTGVLVPIWVGFLFDLMKDSSRMTVWSVIFFSSAASCCLTNIFFLIFANPVDQDDKFERKFRKSSSEAVPIVYADGKVDFTISSHHSDSSNGYKDPSFRSSIRVVNGTQVTPF